VSIGIGMSVPEAAELASGLAAPGDGRGGSGASSEPSCPRFRSCCCFSDKKVDEGSILKYVLAALYGPTN